MCNFNSVLHHEAFREAAAQMVLEPRRLLLPACHHVFQHPLTFKCVFRAACGKVLVWGLLGSGQRWEVEAVMNEMLMWRGFFLPGGSGRSTPAHLHQHIVSAFVFALAAETVWQGSWGLGIYKRGGGAGLRAGLKIEVPHLQNSCCFCQ